ncbi:peptidoglycan-binding protein [Streptomyces sp. NPDC058612]|uniref:N-acetylmuramoyl-L-alanine amidase n=1 Tax=Streptomyces sp. NPDC058612 TaxID=3346555 RepID=UPI0036483F77
MADPLSADRFLAALLAEGVRVQEHPGWRTHNRNHKGPWGPVHGVIVHHTVSKGSAYTVELCRAGHSTLPGPLCQGVITKDGVLHLIGYGRCNHAGGGDPDTLAAVKAESYGVRPPVPNVGNSDGIDGNRAFYGWECENLGDGKDPWTAEQLDTIERASAAVCRAHGWSAKSVIGHLEWSDDKPDPRGFAMSWMRDEIAARLGTTPTKPPTTPTPPPAAKYEPYPGKAFFMNGSAAALGKVSSVFTQMGNRLIARGFGRYYSVGAGPKLGRADVNAYEAYQRSLGYSGDAATWPPGPTTWDKLQVPNT